MMATMAMTRRATAHDLAAITDIYNEAILNTVATFDTGTKTIKEQKKWFNSHDSQHPVLVAEQDSVVVGWASLSKWSDRCAYSSTAEVSLYVKHDYRGKGIGKTLLKALIQTGENAGIHTAIARITEGNEASISLFRQEGFENVGVMKEVGRKFDRLLDVFILQKIFESKSK